MKDNAKDQIKVSIVTEGGVDYIIACDSKSRKAWVDEFGPEFGDVYADDYDLGELRGWLMSDLADLLEYWNVLFIK
tara:strand:- start:102 stop:329 length:228 start_codon:yes stop_codon:yes gene_type:complete